MVVTCSRCGNKFDSDGTPLEFQGCPDCRKSGKPPAPPASADKGPRPGILVSSGQRRPLLPTPAPRIPIRTWLRPVALGTLLGMAGLAILFLLIFRGEPEKVPEPIAANHQPGRDSPPPKKPPDFRSEKPPRDKPSAVSKDRPAGKEKKLAPPAPSGDKSSTGGPKEAKKDLVPGPAAAKKTELIPGQVTLMGTTARGGRFCFIIDRSDSMATVGTSGVILGGEPAHQASLLGRAQKELKRLLENLKPENQFYIIYFDARVDEMPGQKWLTGGKQAKEIIPWMMSIRNRDGTLPLPAFKRAFTLDPVPDAIFFLTDGGLFPDTPDALARMNSKKIPIHVLHLGLDQKKLAEQMKQLKGIGPPNPAMQAFMQNFIQNLAKQAHQGGEALLKRMARDSAGSYRFVGVFD